MPRSGGFILEEMRSLSEQLAFGSEATARRQLAATRILIERTEPDALYGWSDVVWQITQFRAERRTAESELQVIGESLRRDLCELVLRLSHRAPERAADAQTIAQTARSWSVSERTIHRLRKRGLAACWMRRSLLAQVGGVVLGIRTADATAFYATHAKSLARAARTKRLTTGAQREILRRAGALAMTGERRVSNAARAIAGEVGVSTETVRSLIVRNRAATAGKLIGRGPRDLRRAASALAAWQRGMRVSLIARNLACSQQTADRLIHRARAQFLRIHAVAISPDFVEIPKTFFRADAREVILGALAVRSNLVSADPIEDAQAWTALRSIEGSRSARVQRTRVGGDGAKGESSKGESARLMAVRFLHWSARTAVEQLPSTRPSEAVLDRIETDLRWARLLLRSLLGSAMPAIVTRVRVWSDGEIASLAPHTLQGILELAAESLLVVVRESDPAHIASARVRLEQAVSLQLDRRLLGVARPNAKHAAGAGPTLPWCDPLDAQCRWQIPLSTIEARVDRIAHDAPDRSLWQLRLGMRGSHAFANHPMTIAEIAALQQKPVSVIAARLGRAIATTA
ncbi:MAG: hypothetical protein EXS01_00685 [Phycisphaerales bacterium]|nr:hypothetical protein [Phycisphaerales bacterium]